MVWLICWVELSWLVCCLLHKEKINLFFNYGVMGYRFHAHQTHLNSNSNKSIYSFLFNFILPLLWVGPRIKRKRWIGLLFIKSNIHFFRSIQRHAEEEKWMYWFGGLCPRSGPLRAATFIPFVHSSFTNSISALLARLRRFT